MIPNARVLLKGTHTYGNAEEAPSTRTFQLLQLHSSSSKKSVLMEHALFCTLVYPTLLSVSTLLLQATVQLS